MSHFNKVKVLRDAIVGENFVTGDRGVYSVSSFNTDHVNIKDRHLYMNNGYSLTDTQDFGLIANVGLDNTPIVVGDLVQVRKALKHQNNGIYQVDSIGPNINIAPILTGLTNFVQGEFVEDPLTQVSTTLLDSVQETDTTTNDELDLSGVSVGFTPSDIDDYYKDWQVVIAGSTSIDGTYMITGYTGSTTKIATVTPSFTGESLVPGATVTLNEVAVVEKVQVSILKGNTEQNGSWVVSSGSSKSELDNSAVLIGTNTNKIKTVTHASSGVYTDTASFDAVTSDINDFSALVKAADLHQYYILDTEDTANVVFTLPEAPPNGTEIVFVKKGASADYHGIINSGSNTFDGDTHTSINLIANNEKFTLVYDNVKLTWYIL